jgi:hypothetical protein
LLMLLSVLCFVLLSMMRVFTLLVAVVSQCRPWHTHRKSCIGRAEGGIRGHGMRIEGWEGNRGDEGRGGE